MEFDEQYFNHIIAGVKRELLKSNKKHDPVFNTPHEGWAVLKEELEEVWEEIKKDDIIEIQKESYQLAAMAVKLLYSLPFILEKDKSGVYDDTEN